MNLYRVDLVSENGQFLNACYVYAETGFEARKLGAVWIADHMGDCKILPSDGLISRRVDMIGDDATVAAAQAINAPNGSL